MGKVTEWWWPMWWTAKLTGGGKGRLHFPYLNRTEFGAALNIRGYFWPGDTYARILHKYESELQHAEPDMHVHFLSVWGTGANLPSCGLMQHLHTHILHNWLYNQTKGDEEDVQDPFTQNHFCARHGRENSYLKERKLILLVDCNEEIDNQGLNEPGRETHAPFASSYISDHFSNLFFPSPFSSRTSTLLLYYTLFGLPLISCPPSARLRLLLYSASDPVRYS